MEVLVETWMDKWNLEKYKDEPYERFSTWLDGT